MESVWPFYSVLVYVFIYLEVRLILLVQTEISQQLLDGLPSNFVIHGSQRMDPNDFGNPLTFSTIVSMRLTFVVVSEMLRQILNGRPLNLVQTFMSSSG